MPFQNYSAEILYSFVIILCSLLIYFETRKLYELSSHKGIKYLRESFLFFAIAYFFRSFIKIVFISMDPPKIMNISPVLTQFTSMFVFIYFSSMAIFYLVYSMVWKKWDLSNKIYLFHLAALIISTVSLVLNSSRIYLLINFFILLIILGVTYKEYIASGKHKKKKNALYIIYILLFTFWILNVIDILVPEFLKTFQLLIYLFSLGIFLTILYKVLKQVGSN